MKPTIERQMLYAGLCAELTELRAVFVRAYDDKIYSDYCEGVLYGFEKCIDFIHTKSITEGKKLFEFNNWLKEGD